MIRDSGSHRIFKIDELTRLIAGQLVLISRGSAVNLACACRYLEECEYKEPVLSTLWEKRWSLHTLLERGWEHPTAIHGARVVRGPNPLLEESNTHVVTLVGGRGGSTTRGLEQSPALCVLDAPNPCG